VDAFIEHGPRAVAFLIRKPRFASTLPLVFPYFHAEVLEGRKAADRWWPVPCCETRVEHFLQVLRSGRGMLLTNGNALADKDPASGKGSKAYNRYQGDALHAPTRASS